MKNFLKRNDGFTLVELVVAMTILLIILAMSTTMMVSSSQVSGKITSSSEAQTAAANIMERVRILTVNSREVRIIDNGATSWAGAAAKEYDEKDGSVTVEKYSDNPMSDAGGEVTKSLRPNYGYIVCGNPGNGTAGSMSDGGITIMMPGDSGLGSSELYSNGNTTGAKLLTRFYKTSATTLKIRIWAVENKRFDTWEQFEAVGIAARDAAPADKKDDAYFDALKDNSLFYQETKIALDNAGTTSKRLDGNTGSLSEGRVLKFYIE